MVSGVSAKPRLGNSLCFEERNQPSFTSTSTGAAFVLTYKSSERSTETLGYQIRRSEVSDITADVNLDEETENLNLASLRTGYRYDSRNDFFIPTSGRFGEFGLEYGAHSLGSELDFLRATGSLAYYQPLHERTTAAIALRSGWITPLEDDGTIPLQERFFNGGENTVRSYTESRLGPLDADGDPLGGEAFAAASVELRQELGATKLSAAVFYDLGFVVSDHSDYFDPDEPNIGSALGVGVRYRLPVGPLRVDLGWNPNRSVGEDEFVLNFSLGMAF
jgi:outer membrane protein insertion porin family